MVFSDTLEDAKKGTRLYRIVVRNDFVVLPHLRCRYADVRSFLAGALIAKFSQGFDKIRPGDVPWQLHRANTSSRTK